MTYHFHCTITPPNKSVSFSTKIKLVEEPWRGDPNKSLQILWNPYKSLQLLLSPYKSLHITGNLHKPLQILTTPYKSLHILTHPQRLRWERGQRLGNLEISRAPKRAVFLLSFY